MSASPLVTVLLPVYNGAADLDEAVHSILTQRLTDLELLVVDDGSTDATPDLLAEHARRDGRLRVHRQANQGVAVALNEGLARARGTYVARMDADDVSHRDRLASQVDLMERQPRVGVCGSWVETIGHRPRARWRYPTGDRGIRCHLLFDTPFAHGAVMFRRSVLAETDLVYDPGMVPAEDYDLWVRLLEHTCAANLSRVLLHYRLHESQSTRLGKDRVVERAGRVRRALLLRLGIDPTPAELALHQSIGTWSFETRETYLEEVERWLRRLHEANLRRQAFPEPELSRELGRRWWAVCRAASGLGWPAMRAFLRSPLRSEYHATAAATMRFAAASTVRGMKRWLGSS